MIKIHYFTYAGHADLLTWTLGAALATINRSRLMLGRDISLTVIDDDASPCPEEAISRWQAQGVEYRTSDFPRRGNLNGQVCIMGILREFRKSITDDSDVVVKMDSDTLLMGTRWLDDFIADTDALITASDDRGCIYGMCYALKPLMVDELIRLFDRCPVGDRAQEDVYLGCRARRIAESISGIRGFLPIPIWLTVPDAPMYNGPHGQLITYNWHQGTSIAHLYDSFQVVNVCNGMLRGQTTMADVKALIDILVSRR